jgi:hypothetical protein
MAELTVPRVDFSSLGDLPQLWREGQNRQRLSDLGKGLADGTIDYRAAAARTADMGDITHSLQFLALDEAQKKRVLEQKAAADFGSGLGSSFGANPAPSAAPPNPMPVPGARAPIPAPAAGAPVPSSSRVVGDEEGVSSGIYDKPVVPGQRPPVQMAQAAPQAVPSAVSDDNLPSAKHIPFLLKSLTDPNLPAGQREIAKTMLTEAYKNAKEPEKIQTLRALKDNPALLDIEKQLRAGTTVNIDQKGETEFAKAGGSAIAKRFEKLSEEGQTATQDLALVGQLRDLGAVVKTGAPAAIQGWLAERGVKVGDNVGAVEAYGSIIDKLTPQQRVPGSGATSDYEGRMFKNSLPKLINTPGGNEIISNTLAGLAQYKLDRATIAEKALTREITPAEALKQMRELPNPYENFKEFAKTGFKADPNNPASAIPPQDNGARVVPSTKVEIDQSLANAKARIARDPGSRNMVLQKLKEAGLPTDGI